MPHNKVMDIRFCAQDNFVYATVLAPMDAPQLLSRLAAITRNPNFDTSMSLILDVHALDLIRWSGDNIRQMSALVSEVDPSTTAKRVAVVDSSDAGFGMLRMWHVHTNNIAPGERMVFRDIRDAICWCRAREAQQC